MIEWHHGQADQRLTVLSDDASHGEMAFAVRLQASSWVDALCNVRPYCDRAHLDKTSE